MTVFFHKEERLGFTVSEVMKHCWAADLHVLKDIKDICDANGLKFFAAYGTLLGAVRHAGYIPWDDDIDIGMVRDDYIALTDLLIEDGKYNVLNPYTRSWYNMNFSHITNNNDLCFEREYLKKWEGSPFLTGPDIFPYYYIPRDPSEEEYILSVLKKIDEAIGLSKQVDAIREQKGKVSVYSRINEALAVALVGLQKETGYTFNTDRPIQNQLEILYDQVCRITEAEDADYLTRYDEYTKDRSKKFPKEYLENVFSVPFEKTTIPVPAGFGAVLRARFGGGYLRPEKQRGAHDYPFYKKQLGDVGNKLEEAAIRANKTAEIRNELPFEAENGKKIFVYYSAIRELIIHSDRAEDKIKEVLDYFAKRNSKYLLCWIPGEFIENDEFAFDLLLPEFIKHYKELIRSAEDVGVYVATDNGDFDGIVKNADIFYGDAGLVSEAFEKEGKPVIQQDYDIDTENELAVEEGQRDE